MDRLGDLDRTPVDLNEVPKTLISAVVATEDHTFFDNPGVDVRSSFRAFLSNVGSGGIGQGGSTITQQLIKNRYFTNPKRDLDRKIREAILAARLTGEWSKRRILQEYLNTVYFGANAYGVQAAAQRIIGVPLAQLDLAQSALLAGVIKDPINFDPFTHPEAAIRRRMQVLRAMQHQKKITAAQAAYAGASPLPTRPDCNAAPNDPKCLSLQPHSLYSEEVKNRLLELKELGPDEKTAAQRVFAGGLRVYTAYQPAVQEKAQAAVDNTVGRFAPTYQAGMAVMNPRTGEVPAIVNGTGRDYRGQDLATMGPATFPGRFVGSTFKPITLATAIENGYSPKDTVAGGSPCYIKYADGIPGQPGYRPWYNTVTEPRGHKFTNSSDGSGGTDTLYNQTKNSVNCAFLNLFTSVGPPKVLEMAARLGMIRPVAANLSTGIGDTGHSPLEMATVYSTFAAEGIRHDPVFIRRVEDSEGRVLYRAPGGKRELSPQVARTVTDVLSHVTEGTAPNAKLADDRPLAGQDRNARQRDGRVVRGLHASAHRGRLDGQPGGVRRCPRHAQRRRGPGLRRDVPGDDLAEVHDLDARGPADRAVHEARRHAVAGAVARQPGGRTGAADVGLPPLQRWYHRLDDAGRADDLADRAGHHAHGRAGDHRHDRPGRAVTASRTGGSVASDG